MAKCLTKISLATVLLRSRDMISFQLYTLIQVCSCSKHRSGVNDSKQLILISLQKELSTFPLPFQDTFIADEIFYSIIKNQPQSSHHSQQAMHLVVYLLATSQIKKTSILIQQKIRHGNARHCVYLPLGVAISTLFITRSHLHLPACRQCKSVLPAGMQLGVNGRQNT